MTDNTTPAEPTRPGPRQRTYRQLPRGIWALGLVSMFMDISSELVHSLLPVFMATTLGASMITIGIIEGIAEAIASFTKVFSGVLSDYVRRRKILVVTGYGLAALTKLVFPLATSVGWVAAARMTDRIGKGIRGAPRDALIAALAPPALRGAAYGLRQALDSAGAFIGPLLAVVFMLLLADNIQAVLWIAVIPGFLAVFLLITGVHEPEYEQTGHGRHRLTLHDARRLQTRYWLVVILGAVFTLARFSEAFLILRAQDSGMEIAYVPVIMIVMNIVYAVFAYPAGAAADRYPPRWLLLAGSLVLITADVILASATTPAQALLGAACWGLHMALTQGLLAKLVADTSPDDLRGTAFGLFNLITGAALLLASVIAGALWSQYGASATFYAGAGFAAIAALGMLGYRSGRQ